MAPKPKAYYGYTEKGKDIVTDTKPTNFKELPNSKAVIAPNPDIARQVYLTDLRINKERKEK